MQALLGSDLCVEQRGQLPLLDIEPIAVHRHEARLDIDEPLPMLENDARILEEKVEEELALDEWHLMVVVASRDAQHVLFDVQLRVGERQPGAQTVLNEFIDETSFLVHG